MHLDTVRRQEGWRPFAFAVLGDAGVGKSALLNALISRRQRPLPCGGIGPLTGAACQIVFSDSPRFRVRYRPAKWLADACREIERGVASPRTTAQVSVLVGGNDGDPEVLAREGRQLLDPSGHDRNELRRALQQPRRSFSTTDGAAALLAAIRDHVSGPLGVLGDWMELGWPSVLLERGIELVDLPGMGVAHDPLVYTGRAWLERADGVLLCVDRAGVTEATSQALQASGFLARLGTGQAFLCAAVLKMDQLASDRRVEDRSVGWCEHLAATRKEAAALVSAQIAAMLSRALGHAAECVAPCPVIATSTHEYQRFFASDPDEPPRVADPESTGIPELARHLDALARIRASAVIPAVCQSDLVPAARQSALESLLELAIDKELDL